MSPRLRVKVRDRWYSVEVGRLHTNPIRVLVDGEPVEVQIERVVADVKAGPADDEPPPQPPQREASNVGPAAAIRVFSSPMPGIIVSVAARVGDTLVTGDEVCVLEAMKMQQTLRADWSGIVRAVRVEPGQQVRDGDPIIELE
jgi:biotin carboxyl carrier protein